MKTELYFEFDMKDLRYIKNILSMKIVWDKKLFSSHQSYIENFLLNFFMFSCKSIIIPISNENKEYMKCVSYSNVVSSLMFEMIHIMMYVWLAHICLTLEKYWQIIKWTLRYLKNYIDTGLYVMLNLILTILLKVIMM